MNERVRAIIIKKDKILLIKRVKSNETYWVFPGGGIESGETKEVALVREVKEELGLDIKAKELFLERPSDKPELAGIAEVFFTADVVGGKLGSGDGPEFKKDTIYEGQYIFEWIDLKNLLNIDIRPNEVRDVVFKKFYKQ